MFRAFFEDMENIGDLETVVRIGVTSGLDGADLRQSLEQGDYRQQVDDGIRWSRQIGVTAVPTFVFDESHGIVGAQDYEVFQSVMHRLGYSPRQQGGASVP
jgi:predicted DsbA family dithiol-disulfide isomerase